VKKGNTKRLCEVYAKGIFWGKKRIFEMMWRTKRFSEFFQVNLFPGEKEERVQEYTIKTRGKNL
jgi:hypothetical protein